MARFAHPTQPAQSVPTTLIARSASREVAIGTQPTRPLYRVEAVNAKRTQWLGDIVLIRPLSFSLIVSLAVLFAGLVVTGWSKAATPSSTVSGQLIPDTGVIRIYVPQSGIVLEKHVTEGALVHQGDVLYVLSSERQSSAHGETQATISKQVREREHSLQDELVKTHRMQQAEHEALVRRIAAVANEALNLDGQISSQRNRVQLGQDAVDRYQKLAKDGFVSKDSLQPKQADLLDQRTRLQALERDRITLGRDLASMKNDLANLPYKQENLSAQIERSITSAEQELTESEAKRRVVITAPETGIATTAVAEVGQTVDVNRALVAIVPSGARMQAHLYVPSKAVGFVKPGDAVLLRYQAFPYQKFGQHNGKVIAVSKTALSGLDLTGGASAMTEPMYLVTVDLASQTVGAYGKPQALQAGMLLEADVLQDTRKLYEWVLEPLYSLSGKF